MNMNQEQNGHREEFLKFVREHELPDVVRRVEEILALYPKGQILNYPAIVRKARLESPGMKRVSYALRGALKRRINS